MARLLHLFRLMVLHAVLSVFGIGYSYAAGVEFTGKITVTNACTVTVRNHGALGLSADKKTLSSKISGGSSGIADVQSNGPYDVYAETSGKFSIFPAGGNIGTVVSSFFSGIDIYRGRNFAEQSGAIPVKLRGGTSVTRLNVHLVANRTGSVFPGGQYQGIVVIRCE
jgi:hypothetical protein